MRPAGFTLIEVLVVLSLIAVLLVLSIPAFTIFSQRLALNASARALASDLRVLQSRAIEQHRTLTLNTISFSPSGYPPPGGSGTVVLKNRMGQMKKVVVSSAGRVRIE
ncbi:MAG: prepilin-type N-terminal cleavage/methylation domain-containing protein [Candidatus Margulisbacteria bacterium]|nr:prepilin-type N-terminal cleavage/methylation domain-containing protein [Candidatus Margulisiibacteriota bacterium]